MAKKPKNQSRNRSGNEIICGFHGIEAQLASAPAQLIDVLFDDRRHDQRAKRLQQDLVIAGISFRTTQREELEALSQGVKHQGVIARIQSRNSPDETDLYQLLDRLDHQAFLLILDQIQDPHNLGACLRTADGAGVDAVILPKDGACPVNPTVTRVAAGAVGRLPVFYVSNLSRTMEKLKQRGIWITGGADESNRLLYDIDFNTDVAIVMGAEGHGLRRLTREHCDQLARIPMAGTVSSLNVSVATGLILFEVVRQRAIEH